MYEALRGEDTGVVSSDNPLYVDLTETPFFAYMASQWNEFKIQDFTAFGRSVCLYSFSGSNNSFPGNNNPDNTTIQQEQGEVAAAVGKGEGIQDQSIGTSPTRRSLMTFSPSKPPIFDPDSGQCKFAPTASKIEYIE